jgi:hypothetical protein
MIGVPAVTFDFTTIDPPKIDCSAVRLSSSPVASMITPELVLTASRPAISLPSPVPGSSTAAGDWLATRLASASATGATTYPVKSSPSAT